MLCWETPARKCLHVLPLLGDTSKKVFDGEDLAPAKIKTSYVKKERVVVAESKPRALGFIPSDHWLFTFLS